MVLIAAEREKKIAWYENCFRPLAGIMVLIKFIWDSSTSLMTRFRPLAGIMVLIMPHWFMKCVTCGRSFRPLAGIMVLIKTMRTYLMNCLASFRPLAGIMVLIKKRKR